MATNPIYSWQTTDKLKADQAAKTFGAPIETSYAGGATGSPTAPASFGGVQSPTAAAAPAPSFGGTSGGFGAFGAAAPPAGATPAVGPKPPSFADAIKDNPFAQPLVTSASHAIMDNLSGQAKPSFADSLARNNFITGADEATRKVQEQSALGGRVTTGQAPSDAANFLGTKILPQRANFEAGLADAAQKRANDLQQSALGQFANLAGTAQQGDLQQQQINQTGELTKAQLAQTNELTRLGLAQTKELGLADLSVREKTLAQNGSQFNDELSFKKDALAKGFTENEAQRAWQATQNDKAISSTEKIALANLSVKEKELAQNASQFTDELSFKKFATQGGWNQQEVDRTWKAMENEKDRTATATESALGRELTKYLGEQGLNLDAKKLEASIKESTSRLDFDKTSLAANLDEATKDRLWKSNERDIQNKWASGQQLNAQEHQTNLTRLQGEIETGKAQLEHTLNLDTLDKQQANAKVLAELANTYQTQRDSGLYSHEQIMEGIKTQYASALQAQGFDEKTALQAAEIKANSIEKAKDRSLEKLQAEAELSYKYQALDTESGLKREEIAQHKTDMANNLSVQLKGLGLDEKKIDAAIKSQTMQDQMGMASTMIQLAGDNPDALEFATKNFLGTLKAQGTITPEQYDAGIKSVAAPVVAPKTKPSELSHIGTLTGVNDLGSAVDKLGGGDVLGAGKDLIGAGLRSATLPITLPAHAISKTASWVKSWF